MAEDFGLDFKPLRLPKRKRQRQQQQEQPQEIDPGVLQSLGGMTLGAVGAVGNLLDTPGSMVRDVVSGKNPFDQLANPFSDQNRITGRELLRQKGMIGQQDTWGNFAGGLAAEVATDPFTLLGFSALGKTAKGAQLAKTGATTTKTLGGGIRAGERALAAGKVPFGPRWAVGTGEQAAKIGDKLDLVHASAAGSTVGRGMGAMFNSRNRGVVDPVAQSVARRAEELMHRATAPIKAEQLAIAKKLNDLKLTDAVKFRASMESKALPGVNDYVPHGIKQEIRGHLEDIRQIRQQYGLHASQLEDKYAAYFPRGIRRVKKGDLAELNQQVTGVRTARDKRRESLFKDWQGATGKINEFVRDPNLHKILDEQDAGLLGKQQTEKKLYDYIKQEWGGEFDEHYLAEGKPKLNPEWEKFALGPDSPKSKLRKDLKTMYATDLLIDRKGTLKKISAEIRDQTPPKMIVPVIKKDRAKDLAKWVNRRMATEVETSGLFNKQPLDDYHAYKMGNYRAITNQHALNETLFNLLPENLKAMKDPSVPRDFALGPNFHSPIPDALDDVSVKIAHRSRHTKTEMMSFNDMYRRIGHQNPLEAAAGMLRQHGIEVDEDTISEVLNSTLPASSAKDLAKVMDNYKAPQQSRWLLDAYKEYLNLFKGIVLSHPATKVRDYVGGAFHNMVHGLATPFDYAKAHSAYLGKPVKGMLDLIKDNQEVLAWGAQHGLDATDDKTATDIVRYLYASQGPGDVFKHTDTSGSVIESSLPSLDKILGVVPGAKKSTVGGNIKQWGRTFIGKDGYSLDPRKVRGVRGNTETTFGPVAAFEKTGEYTDTMNRLAPFIKLLGEGFDPATAMQRINDVQVNYDPKTFTETEKMLKLIFPFYSYSSRMGKHVVKELATKPGGGLANTLRVENAARDRTGQLPDHLSDTSAIPDPFYKSTDGSKQFFTGLGLMHQDTLQFLQPSVSEVGGEFLSRLNPIAQKGLEAATGRSLYFKGPDGGRPINELDPTIGRILANVTGQKDAVQYPGSGLVETLNSLSPTSRLTTAARQLTDPRKDLLTKLGNTLTGIKRTTVSPQQMERTLKRKLAEAAKGLGGRTFEQVYFPDEQTLSGQAKERVDAYKEVIKALGQRSKARSKDKLKRE